MFYNMILPMQFINVEQAIYIYYNTVFWYFFPYIFLYIILVLFSFKTVIKGIKQTEKKN